MASFLVMGCYSNQDEREILPADSEVPKVKVQGRTETELEEADEKRKYARSEDYFTSEFEL